MTLARFDIGENIEFETSSGNVFADIAILFDLLRKMILVNLGEIKF